MTAFVPNVKKLIMRKMSFDAVPSGGGVADAITFLTQPKKIAEGWRKAEEWTRAALAAVRNAADPNPWRYASDEDIAGELLRKANERERTGRFQRKASGKK